jgi:hypothetical protein
MAGRGFSSSWRRQAVPAVAALALGASMPAWGWAAEAHEPSRAGGAPGADAASVFAAPSAEIAVIVPPLSLSAAVSSDAGAPLHEAYAQAVVRRPWHRGQPPEPIPAPPVFVRPRQPAGWVTFRGGYFDQDDVGGDQWLAGFKLTGRVGDAFQLGVSTDWQYSSESVYGWVDSYLGPGGAPVDVYATQYETHSHLIPILAIAELRPDLGGASPYIGVGMGYEVLVVDVRDYVYGIEYDEDYGGFGVQPYAGLGIALGWGMQVFGEGYGNFSTVSRTVRDAYTGYLVEQKVDVDGFGLRAGLSFGF